MAGMARLPTDALLAGVLPLLDLDERYANAHLLLHPGNGLPSALPVNALACGAVAAAGLSGLALRGGSQVSRFGGCFGGDEPKWEDDLR